MRSEDGTPDARILGIAVDAPVTVIAVTRIGRTPRALPTARMPGGLTRVCCTATMCRVWIWQAEAVAYNTLSELP